VALAKTRYQTLTFSPGIVLEPFAIVVSYKRYLSDGVMTIRNWRDVVLALDNPLPKSLSV